MAQRTKKDQARGLERWTAINESLLLHVPQLSSVLGSEDEFISLHIKARDDGTLLGVLKRYDGDGTPVVCFGGGYTIAGCFLGLEGSIASNKWRMDKPWGADNK